MKNNYDPTIGIMFCIPILQDVIEHVILDGNSAQTGDAIASKLVNVHTLELKSDMRSHSGDLKIFENLNNLLNACVLGTLRNISFRFRECQPSILERTLQDASKIQMVQQRILGLSPKSVTFNVDACNNRNRQMFLAAAELTKNMLEKSFPELFGQGIAKIIVVDGEYKLILVHTGCDVFNIRSILTNDAQESMITTILTMRTNGISCSPPMACGLRA